MNPQKLIEQFLGPNALGNLGGSQQTGVQRYDQGQGGHGQGAQGGANSIGDMVRGALGGFGGNPGGNETAGRSGFGIPGGIPGGAMGGLAAGGLLGALLSQKKFRKMAGGAVGYGGAAALGALAFRAYQNWQAGQNADNAPLATAADAPREGSAFAPATGADGKPFTLAIIRSMIAAANADGHIGADEQKQIFEAANKGGLDAEDKAFIFDSLQNPPSPNQIAALAGSQEQAVELYLAARLVIDTSHPDEAAFLNALAQSLNLDAGLVSHINAQVVRNLES